MSLLFGKIDFYANYNNNTYNKYNFFMKYKNYNIVEDYENVETYRDLYVSLLFNGNIELLKSKIKEKINNTNNIDSYVVVIDFYLNEEEALYIKLKYPDLYDVLNIQYKEETND